MNIVMCEACGASISLLTFARVCYVICWQRFLLDALIILYQMEMFQSKRNSSWKRDGHLYRKVRKLNESWERQMNADSIVVSPLRIERQFLLHLIVFNE